MSSTDRFNTHYQYGDAIIDIRNELGCAEFDPTVIYIEGDKVLYKGTRYSRKSWGADTPAAESWDASHWTALDPVFDLLDGKVNAQQSVLDAGKALGIGQDGKVVPVPFSGEDFTGATSSTAGTHGYVPAPAAGDQLKVLTGDGTWSESPGAKVVDVSFNVSNASGSYSVMVEDERIGSDMACTRVAVGTPSTFRASITVTPYDGYCMFVCPNAVGSSTVKLSFQKVIADPTAITSTEFTILNNRLLAVENVCTEQDVTIQTSDWTLSNGTYTYEWSNSLVTSSCAIEVTTRDGAENSGIEYFDAVKSVGSITFTTTDTPTGSFPVRVTIVNAKADAFQSLSADEISSEAISDCDNVEEALTNLDGRLGNVPSGKTAQGQIDTLNSNIANLKFTKITITQFPYVTPSDGLLILFARIAATGRAYIQTNVFLLDNYNITGAYMTGVLPVAKGTSITYTGDMNIQSGSLEATFMSFGN